MRIPGLSPHGVRSLLKRRVVVVLLPAAALALLVVIVEYVEHELENAPGYLVWGAILAALATLTYLWVRSRERISTLVGSFNRQQALYRSLVENITNVVFILGADGTIRFVTPSVKGILQRPEAELLGVELVSIVHPDDVSLVTGGLKEAAMHPEARPSVRCRLCAADGDYRYADLSLTNHLSELNLAGIVVNAVDMTERVELTRVNKMLASIVESSQDPIISTDLQGRITSWNPAAERLYGYSAAEIIGRPVSTLYVEGQAPDLGKMIERLLAGEVVRYSDTVRRHKAGNLLYVSMNVFPLRDTSGAVVGTAGITHDIRAHKTMENALAESEARHKTVVEHLPVAVYVLKPDTGQVVDGNPAFLDVLGYSREDLGSLTVFDFVAHDRESVQRVLSSLKRNGSLGAGVERVWRRRDGSLVDVHVTGSFIQQNGEQLGFFAVRDITESKRAAGALRSSEDKLRLIADSIRDIIAVISPQGVWEYVSPSHAAVTGHSEDALLGRTFLDFVHPDDIAPLKTSWQARLGPGAAEPLEFRFRTAAGAYIWLEALSTELLGQDQNVTGILISARDVTDRKRLESELERRAFYDALTGLPNRVLLRDRLEHAISRASRSGSRVAVLFIDLDRLKTVNDSLGHDAGDSLIVKVAGRLQASTRPEDTLARMSGDEFVLVMEDVPGVESAVQVAERIATALQSPFSICGQDVFTTASIGITLGGSDADPGLLLQQADAAMYAAKAQGKARYHVFNPNAADAGLDKLPLESELRRAVENDELVVYYQPIISVQSGQITAVEALVRWQHPKHGLLPPIQFIPLAEETDLIEKVERAVGRVATRQLRDWNERLAPELRLSMNMSARSFQDAEYLENIKRAIQEGTDPSRLTLEITESMVMEDADSSLLVLQGLKALGVQLAVDDFGTGYSSLSYLARFPVDLVKIDRAFVAGLGMDPGDTAIVRSVVSLGHALGLKVVAEGVETAEQLEQLREMGCDLVQGYYFARPLAAADAEALLMAQTGVTAL